MNGKGDKARPLSVPVQDFVSNWDRTFSNTKLDMPTNISGKIYVFDLDSTLVEGPDYYSSRPIPGVVDKVNALYDAGNTVIIYTARGATTGICWYQLTKNTLEACGIKHHELRMGKLKYDFWVDDKAINNKDFF